MRDIIIIIIKYLLISLVVFICWNIVIPDILNLKPLTYLQSICLTVLCNTLFSNN